MTENTTPEDRVFMAKITALEAVLRALVATHDDPNLLRLISEKLCEGAKGALLATRWSDEEIERVDIAVQGILSAAGKRAQGQ